MRLTQIGSNVLKGTLRTAAFAAVAAAGFFTASPALADVEGLSLSQSGFAGTATIPEGSSSGYSLTITRNLDTESGFAGTTTSRIGGNTVTFTSNGASGFQTQNLSAGTVQGNQALTGGSFTYNQDGVHTVSYNQGFSRNIVENSSWGLGSSNPTDSQGLSGSINVTVTNVAPTIVLANQNGINGNVTINEGSSVASQMQSTDPGADAQTFVINGAGAGVDGALSGTRTSGVVNNTYNNNGVFGTTFTVFDDDTSTTLNRTVTVNNVLPSALTLSLNGTNGNITINEGDAVSAQMTATDPGADAITFVIDGQAAGVGGSTPGSTRTSSLVGLTNPGLLDEGSVNINGSATDDVGPSNIGRVVTVNNVAPVAGGISGPGTVPYGNFANFQATSTDVGVLDVLTFAWDLDGDGLFDDFTDVVGAGGSATSTATFGPGPAGPPYTVTIGYQVFDGDGGVDTEYLTIAVPEPSSVVLMGLGAVALAVVARRRRK
ncbi:MAG: PEP-CTERM sorting domain-containing protein [Pirellulales bacterium]|nr:PEP-CTERM sorting domain-containing protein [Pirellulales bacterium]